MNEEQSSQEKISETKIDTEPEFEGLAPEEFTADPFGYFESQGVNIKPGETEYDEEGNITEDPTATKDLPEWFDLEDQPFRVVGKKINIDKSQVKKTENPFHEYELMQIAKEFGLPAPEAIAKVSRGAEHLMLMKRVEGIRWHDDGLKLLMDGGFSKDEIETLVSEAEEEMTNLAEVYDSIGVHRNWKHKDMIFQVDISNKKLLGVIPTDWERTKIDREALEQARAFLQ